MTGRPILFSGPMVRALLDGRKTQTRRIIKLSGRPPEFCGGRGDLEDPTCWGWEDAENGEWITLEKDPGQRMGWQDWVGAYAPGDRLWVREAWRAELTWQTMKPSEIPNEAAVFYEADGARHDNGLGAKFPGRKRPGMFMPRWASRLTLNVTDVRVQRLQQISEDDARAEGVQGNATGPWGCEGLIEDFSDLWDGLNALRGYGWDANPWVCAVTFTVHRQNIDKMGAAT